MAGRPESQLDPRAGPVARFAAELRKLRGEAGSPTYRVMAESAGHGASTLSQAAAGERLPTLPVVLAYVRACGGDPEEWEERWQEAAAEAAAASRTEDEDTEAPYRGLARFEPADADVFFGRERLTERLLELTRSRRFTAVFGPSGSGKSSLLRAGLIPRLRDPEAGVVRVLTPGERPLQVHGKRLIPADGDGETWLIVDQFEELYTLCADPSERDQFIDRLLVAADTASRLRVVIAVRADFLGRCAEHPGLTAVLQDGTVLAGPMSRTELRAAVTKPAQAAGMIVERALTARILDQVEGEPGALPLMSHALLETWRRRRGRTLTIQAYEATGGLDGAIARTAEDVHAQLTPSQADLARRVLLRLISPGEATSDTRRPTPRSELDFGDPDDTAKVLELLARARLLTIEHDTVDLAHEALITAWPRLQQWIDDARERLRLHRQLTDAAQTWDRLDRDPGALYRGTRLSAAEETFLRADVERELTPVERDFLSCSLGARRREDDANSRTARRLRQFTAALSILLVLSLAAGVTAWQQSRASERQRRQAVAAQHRALSRQLAAQSSDLLDVDSDLAALLAVQAYRTSPTEEATASLFAAALPLGHRLMGDTTPVESLAFSPDGRTLAGGGDDGSIRLWNTATGRPRATLTGHRGAVEAVAFTPDGRTLASGGDDGSIRLWNTATGRPRLTVAAHTGPVRTVAYSPDGRTLASGGDDGSIRLWNTATGRPRLTVAAHTGPVRTVAYSPDGRTLASGGDDRQVQLWYAATGRPCATTAGHTAPVEAVDFSPDGRTLASGSDDRTVQLWGVPAGTSIGGEPGNTSAVETVVFSPDGRTLASGGDDRTVRLWDTATGGVRATLGGSTGLDQAAVSEGKYGPIDQEDIGDSTGAVKAVAFTPDSRTLASGGQDGTIRLWNVFLPDPRAAIRRIQRAVHRTLTPWERSTYLRDQSPASPPPASPRRR